MSKKKVPSAVLITVIDRLRKLMSERKLGAVGAVGAVGAGAKASFYFRKMYPLNYPVQKQDDVCRTYMNQKCDASVCPFLHPTDDFAVGICSLFEHPIEIQLGRSGAFKEKIHNRPRRLPWCMQMHDILHPMFHEAKYGRPPSVKVVNLELLY